MVRRLPFQTGEPTELAAMLVGERQGPAVVLPSEAQVDANGLGKVLKGDALFVGADHRRGATLEHAGEAEQENGSGAAHQDISRLGAARAPGMGRAAAFHAHSGKRW